MSLISKIKSLTLLAAIPISVFAQQKRSTPLLPLDPAVRTGKLANGFTYYIRHNEEPKNRVLLYLVNKAGSILEDEDQRGLAHFMEHMSFNGTKHFPHNELIDYLQKAGVRFGADINAYTSFDETVYALPLPSDKPALLNKGILIMHDWAQSATLDPAEIDKERGVVLEEKRLGKGAEERMQRVYWPALLNHSRYAVRLPIGLDTVLNNFKRPAIVRFYHDWYRPDLQALIVVGDINADSLERVIKTTFSDLKNPVHERMRTKYIVPLKGKNQFLAVTDKEMTTTVAEVIIKHLEPPLRSTGDYRNSIIKDLFNRMLRARYQELSLKPDVPFVQGGAGINYFIGNIDSYNVSVVARPGKLEQGFKAVWRETERVKRFGFTATELDRAKTAYLNGLETRLQEKDKTASESFVQEYQDYFLRDIAAPGITAETELTRRVMPTITLMEVNNLTQQYTTNTDRDILIKAPDKDKHSLPDEAKVIEWLKAVEEENLAPYKDDISTQSLLANEPIPGRTIDEQRDKALNITRLTLSNGVKVILKPTDFKNDQILFSAFAPGGTSLYSDTDFQSAANAAGIIHASGAGNYSPDQLEKYLEGRQFSLTPYIFDREQGISGASTKKDLETALQMIYADFTEPRKDTMIFKGIIEKSSAALANRNSDPNKVFSDTVRAVLSNYNLRKTGPSLQKLEQINLDRAYEIYKQRFADAANFTFTFVGSIDTAKMKPLLEKYLGGLPSTHSHETARELHIGIPGGRITKNFYKGSEPKSTVLLVYSGKFDYNADNKVKLDALKETLQIRLLERLREDEGGVYSPGVFADAYKYPEGHFKFMIQFGCAPENVDRLVASTLDEIDKLKTNGPLQKNIDKWRSEEKASIEPQLKDNGFWVNYINERLQDEERLDQINGYYSLLDRVSPSKLKIMADQCLSGENYIQLVLLPESMASTK